MFEVNQIQWWPLGPLPVQNLQYLLQMLLKMQIQGQFWILLVLRIPKHLQKVKFDKDLAELLKH